jgi:hypothetical protein
MANPFQHAKLIDPSRRLTLDGDRSLYAYS